MQPELLLCLPHLQKTFEISRMLKIAVGFQMISRITIYHLLESSKGLLSTGILAKGAIRPGFHSPGRECQKPGGGAKMPSPCSPPMECHFGHGWAHVAEPRLATEGRLGPPVHPPASTATVSAPPSPSRTWTGRRTGRRKPLWCPLRTWRLPCCPSCFPSRSRMEQVDRGRP